MNHDFATPRQLRTVLPGIVLTVMAVAFLLTSAARADDPPIVSVGPVASYGNTASADVGSDGNTNACVNDQHSGADPSSADAGTVATLNDASCQATASSSAGTGSTGSTRSTGSTGSSSAGGSSMSSATASVAAGNAVGLRIVRVRHFTNGVGVTKRFRVLVTLRDVCAKRVRGAIVSISRVPGASSTISGVHSTFSNKLGQARITVPVTKSMLGRRLFLKIAARTPKARAIALRSVRLPALG